MPGRARTSSPIVFLLYMNRSGSTFLSSLLDQYSDIGVTPEADIPDGLLSSTANVKTWQDLDRYMDRLYEDRKFQNWNINRAVLYQALVTHGYPYGYGEILPVILKSYFHDEFYAVQVYKRGHYINHVPALRVLFPGCRFIFIERDIRGIYESQKRSIDSVSRKVMALNPVERAIKYVRTMRLVEKYSRDPDFLVLMFEKLILSPELVKSKILTFLDVSDTRASSADYYKKIPESQRHLHKGVLKKPAHDKIDAWKQNLSKAEIKAIQRIAGTTLRKRGYGVDDLPGSGLQHNLFFARACVDLLFRHAVLDMLRKTKTYFK